MRYIVTEKGTGKELLNKEFLISDEAVAEVKKLFAAGIKPDGIEVRIDEGSDLPAVILSDEQVKSLAPRIRKSRSDAGKPHSKAEPAKKIRNRGQFFVYVQDSKALEVCETKENLTTYLNSLSNNQCRIIQGHELKFERKVQFTLKLVK